MSENIEQLQNLTKEQRIESLKNAICKAIFGDELLMSEDDFSTLRLILPQYIKMKLGVEDINIYYSSLTDKTIGYSSFEKNTIEINAKKFQFGGTSETFTQDLEKIINLYNVIAHEISHVIDERQNTASNSTRIFIAGHHTSLIDLAKIYPEKEKIYKALSDSLYFTDRSEVFARKSADKHTKQFVSELTQYAKEKFPFDEQAEQEYSNFLEYQKNREANSNIERLILSEKTFSSVIANFKIDIITKIQNYFHEIDEKLLSADLLSKEKHLSEVKKDFEQIMEKFFDLNCFDEDIVNYNPFLFVSLLEIPEFYNKAYVEQLYEYAKQHNKKILGCYLSENFQELDIGARERKENSKYLREVELETAKSQEKTQESEFKI